MYYQLNFHVIILTMERLIISILQDEELVFMTFLSLFYFFCEFWFFTLICTKNVTVDLKIAIIVFSYLGYSRVNNQRAIYTQRKILLM